MPHTPSKPTVKIIIDFNQAPPQEVKKVFAILTSPQGLQIATTHYLFGLELIPFKGYPQIADAMAKGITAVVINYNAV